MSFLCLVNCCIGVDRVCTENLTLYVFVSLWNYFKNLHGANEMAAMATC